jgi:hypothetical protein
MKLSHRSITALQKVITGDPLEGGSPVGLYRSGPKLVEFFNDLGFEDAYPRGGGFPSRWDYTESRLREMNGSTKITRAITAAVYPAEFVGTPFSVEEAVEYLNRHLENDGLKLVRSGRKYVVQTLDELSVSVEVKLEPAQQTLHEFIREQLEKCDRKLQTADFDGAITNARSLVEAVLTELENRLTEQQPAYDGDLPKLYRRAISRLNLDPARKDVADSVKQVLSGLVNVVSGLAPLRNKLGDAHVQQYRPQRHHAKLAVNAAKTLCDFLFDTFEYQSEKGLIVEVTRDRIAP